MVYAGRKLNFPQSEAGSMSVRRSEEMMTAVSWSDMELSREVLRQKTFLPPWFKRGMDHKTK